MSANFLLTCFKVGYKLYNNKVKRFSKAAKYAAKENLSFTPKNAKPRSSGIGQ